MRYTEYKGYTKTYVLVHNTGYVVYETDDYEDAKNKVSLLEIESNSAEDIKSSWCNNTYHINVNTLSKEGKKLLNILEKNLIKSGKL